MPSDGKQDVLVDAPHAFVTALENNIDISHQQF
jgi:hypothetical protein